MANPYTIKGITEVPQVDREGEIYKIHRVRAVTAKGQPFSIEIPEAEFNDARVRELVAERVKLIDGLVA